jgi:hypothetical protein
LPSPARHRSTSGSNTSLQMQNCSMHDRSPAVSGMDVRRICRSISKHSRRVASAALSIAIVRRRSIFRKWPTSLERR